MKYIKFLLILLLMPSVQSFAQADEGTQFSGLEEIIVTARKREEPLQETPVAVTALTEAKLDKMFATDLQDLDMQVPNTIISRISSFNNSVSVFMRGIGNTDIDSTIDPPVAIFVDGIYIPRPNNSAIDMFDIEQVEVMRGPQGTLFGRNTTAGAIQFRTKRPTGEFGTSGRITLGEYGRRDVRLSVESPLTDNISAKISVLQQKFDGYYQMKIKNHPSYDVGARHPYDDRGQLRDAGGEDVYAVRPIIKFNPTENFELTIIGEYIKERSDTRPQINTSIPSQVLARVYGFPGAPFGAERRYLETNVYSFINVDTKGLTVEAVWELDSGTLTSVSNWRETEYLMRGEVDWTTAPMFEIVRDEPHEQQSTELRYQTSINDRTELVAGIYYFEQDYFLRRDTYINTSGAFTAHIIGLTSQSHQNMALFAQVDYQINDKLGLTVGGRYTEEEKDFMQAPFGVTPGAKIYSDDEWSNFGPKVGLDYQINDDAMVYVSLSRGFKSGGFNGRGGTPSTLGPFDEETVDAFEIGLKADWWDNKLRTNAVIFLNRYEDLQRTIIRNLVNCGCPNPQETVTDNAAEAEISGFELEIDYVPNENLNLGLALAYTDAGYEEFFADLNGSGTAVDNSGLPLQRAPEWHALFRFDYTVDMDSGAAVTLGGNYMYRSELNNHTAGNPLANVGEIDIINLHLDYVPPSGNYRVSLYGKNVTDEIYQTSATLVGALLHLNGISDPARFGIEIGWDF